MIRTIARWALWLALALPAAGARAEVSVFTCEPEWKSLAEEIGGERVAVFSATTDRQDPHHIQARPSLIAKLRRAELLVCTGAELEAGWLPLLLRRARNPAVLPGRDGHLMAAEQVTLLETPERLDRADGDVHADGNPHLHLNPENLLRVAQALSERLARIDPDNGDVYAERFANFQARWTQAIERWRQRAQTLAGAGVVVHHKEWIYLLNWLGIERVAALEPKPGLPPAAGHLAGLRATLTRRSALAIIRSPLNDAKPSQWLSEQTGVPALVLPYTVGEVPDLFALFDTLIERLAGLKK